MESIAKIIQQHNLLCDPRAQMATLASEDANIYPASVNRVDGMLFCIGTVDNVKNLYIASAGSVDEAFTGVSALISGIVLRQADLSWDNYLRLKDRFPFIEPVSLRERRTTVGCGDRLGLATPGHLRAVKGYDVSPVLAQQSIRELTLTDRTYQGVVSDAAFLVFQEGYREGYGADGDHLKTIDDIDVALAAGMPMITLDLTEVMNPNPAEWSSAAIEKEYASLEGDARKIVDNLYIGKTFRVGQSEITLTAIEAKRCALMYWDALEFSARVDRHLREKRGDSYDLEISIDETTAPTLPAHHLFIAKELARRDVSVNSLAPRFIGEFQKGIDYIGDIATFEAQFRVHCDISKSNGNYKISIHSGSDKFSVYAIIGTHTDRRLHLKTAGTSWLEAVRSVAVSDPGLYRLIHKKAFQYFEEATKLYHITADLGKIPPLETVDDENLGDFLSQDESRQLIHITYGGLLHDPDVRGAFFKNLARNEELHYQTVAGHIGKHVSLLMGT